METKEIREKIKDELVNIDRELEKNSCPYIKFHCDCIEALLEKMEAVEDEKRKKVFYETKIVRRIANQWHNGPLTSCAINIERIVDVPVQSKCNKSY